MITPSFFRVRDSRRALSTIDFGKLAYFLATALLRLRPSHSLRVYKSSGLTFRRYITKMTSQSDLLQSYQPSFSLPSLPVVPETNPHACVFDSFRIAIAQLLSETLGLDVEKAYSGVDYGKKGEDFTVALPRFRLPGKVEDHAKTVTENVCYLPLLWFSPSSQSGSSHRTNISKASFTTSNFSTSDSTPTI